MVQNLFFQLTLDVQSVANNPDYNWNISSILCLPTQMTLYGLGGEPRNFDCAKQQDKDEYYTLKKEDATIANAAENINEPREIGTGITPTIIQQIIANETEPDPKRTGLYFFDFDKLLSQFNGLDFLPTMDLPSLEWFEQYAKYLFSDYIGSETDSSRLNLLKRMFQVIGPERIYVITANGYANPSFEMKGRVVSWYFQKFVTLCLLTDSLHIAPFRNDSTNRIHVKRDK